MAETTADNDLPLSKVDAASVIAQVHARRPTAPSGSRSRRGIIVPGADGSYSRVDIPHGPGEPGYLDRIPPPDGVSVVGPEPADLHGPGQDSGSKDRRPATMRIVLSFGRKDDQVIVGIEQAPDWDIVSSRAISEDAVKAFLPILRRLVKVKDLTGEFSEGEWTSEE